MIDKKSKSIYENLTNPFTKLYIQFLDFVLPILTTLNIIFQSQNPQIHNIYNEMSSAYKTLLECYLKSDYIQNTDISLIQFRNPNFFLSNDKIYLGGACTLAFSTDNNLLKAGKAEFITNCLNFFVECSFQIYKRFPFKSAHMQLLKSLSFIDPKNIKNITSIIIAAANFPKLNINMNDIDREWRKLRNSNLNFDMNIMEFWKTIRDQKDGNNLEVYPLINKLVVYILILPHSSACVERLFSTINLNKTKIRNRLSTETLTGILHSKNILNNQNKTCYEFNILPEMIKKHTNNIYK